MVIQELSSALQLAIKSTTLDSIEGSGSYDAIVVGAGAAGGLAALLLAEAGARVLVLDAGRRPHFLQAPFRTLSAAAIASAANPRLLDYIPPSGVALGRALLRAVGKVRQPMQSKCFAWAFDPLAFVDDRDCPYVVDNGTRFDWFRSRQIGGRMTVRGHGCQYYRLNDDDFLQTQGQGPVWPFAPGTLDPWYDRVEDRLALSGLPDSTPYLPDSRLRHTIAPTPGESDVRSQLGARWPSITTTLGRHAPPLSSLDLAADTGRLSCRTGAIVREVDVDADGKVRGVKWMDLESGRVEQASAKTVFLCASALESTRILMLSKTADGKAGLGAASGALGRHLMDHVVVSGDGVGPALRKGEASSDARRCVYIPRFDVQSGVAHGSGFNVQVYMLPAGKSGSHFTAVSFSEMRPRQDSFVELDPSRKDAWGIPVLRITSGYSEDELVTAKIQSKAITEIAQALGVRLDRVVSTPPPPGSAMHECGTARMGASPQSSVLDADNQCWDAKGLYVTDGAALPSQGINNPTLTIMALTARACAHALSAKTA